MESGIPSHCEMPEPALRWRTGGQVPSRRARIFALAGALVLHTAAVLGLGQVARRASPPSAPALTLELAVATPPAVPDAQPPPAVPEAQAKLMQEAPTPPPTAEVGQPEPRTAPSLPVVADPGPPSPVPVPLASDLSTRPIVHAPVRHPPPRAAAPRTPAPVADGSEQTPHAVEERAASNGQRESLEARIRDAVQAAVRYPAAARMMGVTGQARVQFDYRGGSAEGAVLAQSSGTASLDAAALLATRTAHYPPPPSTLEGRSLRLLVWVEFRPN